MSISSLAYTPPLRRSPSASTLDYSLVEKATELYDEGDLPGAAEQVFRHLFPSHASFDLAAGFTFNQGSSKVTARISDGIFALTVPLVRLPEGGAAIAALRYTLTRINGPAQLYQARLHGEDIVIEMRESLDNLHPHKLLEVLRRAPIEADRHDDWMIGQFKCTAVDRVPVESLTADENGVAVEFWKRHFDDCEELLKETQRKRSMFFLNETTAFAINRLRFVLPLGGSLAPRIFEAVDTFNDTDVDPMKREAALGKHIKEMKAVSADELRASLGHAEYAICPVAEGTGKAISNFFAPGNNYLDTVENLTSSAPLDATLALAGTYYYLLANFWWPTEVEDAFKAGLSEVSGKPLREAAKTLFGNAQQIVTDFVGDDDDDDEEEGDEEEESDDE
jgi:hypothetical protein